MGVDSKNRPLFFHDVNNHVKDFYAIRGVPAIYHYDDKGQLLRLYKGAVGLEENGLELLKERLYKLKISR